MKRRNIKPVESNKQKRNTYAFIMEQYKKAVENGFYGEAELIVYAYLEDRLRSFLYYSDALNTRNSNNINENMISIYGSEKSIKDISAKIEVIKKAINITRLKRDFSDNEYAAHLIKVYQVSLDTKELRVLLNKIDKWRDYRNEVVHALLNKDIDDLHLTFKSHVEEGFLLARRIDNAVNQLKRA